MTTLCLLISVQQTHTRQCSNKITTKTHCTRRVYEMVTLQLTINTERNKNCDDGKWWRQKINRSKKYSWKCTSTWLIQTWKVCGCESTRNLIDFRPPANIIYNNLFLPLPMIYIFFLYLCSTTNTTNTCAATIHIYAIYTHFTFKWRCIWSFFSICSIGNCGTSYGAEISLGNRSPSISCPDIDTPGDSLPV